MKALMEHTVPDSARMTALPDHATIRIWMAPTEPGPLGQRIITVRFVNDGTALEVSAFQSPGGGVTATEVPVRIESNNLYSVTIR